jgi:hypothetical protein
MREGTRAALLDKGPLDEEIAQRAIAAAREAPFEDRIDVGLEAVIEAAEADPDAVRSAVVALRADHGALAQLESCLGGSAKRATFGLGGAIQLALSELASPDPDLRSRRPELTRWLEGGW